MSYLDFETRGRGVRVRRAVGLRLPLAVFLIFTLLPFYWIIVYAFRAKGSSAAAPFPFTFDNLVTVWTTLGFSAFAANSALVGCSVLVCVIILSLLMGYALARFAFRGRAAILVVLLATQFVPGAMLLIPLFIVFRTLGLIDNLGSLIISDTVFQLPLCAILMANFIRNVPIELEEAAWLDGASRFGGFRRVVLPLLGPGVVAVGSFAFIGAWNNFLFALMFMNHQSNFTLPVGLNSSIGQYSADYGALAAGGVVAALPVVIVFAIVQKFLVAGAGAGAVKG